MKRMKKVLGWSMIIPVLIVMTAPLEKLNWKIGFTLRPVMLLSFAAFCLWMLTSLASRLSLRKDLRRVLIVFFLMLLTFLLASIDSLDPVKSIRHVVLYGTLFLLFFLMVEYVRNQEKLSSLIKVWMSTGIFMCVYGILQFVGPFYGFDIDTLFFGMLSSQPEPLNIHKLANPSVRSYSLFGDSNNFAGYLTTVFPFFLCSLLYYYKTGGFGKRLLYLGLVVLVVVSSAMTLSRSGGLGLLTIFLVIFTLKRKEVLSPRSLKLWAMVVLVVVVLVLQYGQLMLPLLEGRITKDTSAKIHLYVAESAIKLFLMNPLTGVGLGNFGPAYGMYFKPGHEYYNAHSAFLSILSETGLIGFAVYMCFYGFVLRQILLFRKHTSGYNREVIADGLLAGFLGLMAANVFYQNFTYQFFWVFLALGFAAGLVAKEGAASPKRKSS